MYSYLANKEQVVLHLDWAGLRSAGFAAEDLVTVTVRGARVAGRIKHVEGSTGRSPQTWLGTQGVPHWSHGRITEILREVGLGTPPVSNLDSTIEQLDDSSSLDRIAVGTEAIEDAQEAEFLADQGLTDTERTSVVLSRRGQGTFRDAVIAQEATCPVTGVSNPLFLVASHIKPWRAYETAFERLDANNGIMLTPNVDRLFDAGDISFRDDGVILVSPLVECDDPRCQVSAKEKTRSPGATSRMNS